MDKYATLIMERLQPLKDSFEREGKTFEEFRLDYVLDGYPTAGYVLYIKADWLEKRFLAIQPVFKRYQELRQKGIIDLSTLPTLWGIQKVND